MAEVFDWSGVPEAQLDGPPPDGELLLRRVLRRVRAERLRLSAEAGAAQLSVALRRIGGQVEVGARVTGVPPGLLCRLVVVTRDDERLALGERFLTERDTAVSRRTTVAEAELTGFELTDGSGAVLAGCHSGFGPAAGPAVAMPAGDPAAWLDGGLSPA